MYLKNCTYVPLFSYYWVHLFFTFLFNHIEFFLNIAKYCHYWPLANRHARNRRNNAFQISDCCNFKIQWHYDRRMRSFMSNKRILQFLFHSVSASIFHGKTTESEIAICLCKVYGMNQLNFQHIKTHLFLLTTRLVK